MKEKSITTPVNSDIISSLLAGDKVLISGIIYTARDAAHKRLVNLIDNDNELPFDIMNQIIYYVGPTPTKPGEIIGSCGPTTSYRMDSYTTKLREKGLKCMIGKGIRNREVIESMKKHGAVYFGAIGGAGALISKSIVKSEIIAYDDLGAEAIHKLTVKNFPVIVIIDSKGNNLYENSNKSLKEVR